MEQAFLPKCDRNGVLSRVLHGKQGLTTVVQFDNRTVASKRIPTIAYI